MTTTHRTPAPFARTASAILTLAAMLVAMTAMATPASAHARLEASSPKDGSTLTATPPEVMLRFNEPIKDGLNQVTVKAGSTDATDGELEVDGNSVYQPLKSSLKADTYTVSYKVVSADGHPVSGSLKFTYAPPAGDDGAGTDEPTSSTSAPSESTSSAATDSSTTPPPASTTEPSSSTSEPTSSSTTSSSSSTNATDGETEPTAPAGTSSSSSTSAAPTSGDESSSDGGIPTWVWIAGLGALAVLLAAAGLIARGRRQDDDEDIDLEEWRG